MTIHILAAVAEHEAAMISARTKAALAAAKARGTKLGGFRGHRFTPEHHEAAALGRRRLPNARAVELAPVITELRAAGVASLGGLARALTERGIPTARGGGRWAPAQVARVLERIP